MHTANETQQIQPKFSPFVFIVDSPSQDDLYFSGGFSIGMALRSCLYAIKIPHCYYFAPNLVRFEEIFKSHLSAYISQAQSNPGIDSFPFIHLCMHGADQGIGLTNGDFIWWNQLREHLFYHTQHN